MLDRQSSKHVSKRTRPHYDRERTAPEAARRCWAIFEPLEGRALFSATPLLPAAQLPAINTPAPTVHVSFNSANGLLLPAVDGALLPAVDGLLLPAVDGLLLPAVEVTTNINHTGVVITVTSADTVQAAFVVATPGGFQLQ